MRTLKITPISKTAGQPHSISLFKKSLRRNFRERLDDRDFLMVAFENLRTRLVPRGKKVVDGYMVCWDLEKS